MSYDIKTVSSRFIQRPAAQSTGASSLQVVGGQTSFLMSLHLIEAEETLEANWSHTPLLTRDQMLYFHGVLPALFNYDSYITNIFAVTPGGPTNISKSDKDRIIFDWSNGSLAGEVQAYYSGYNNFKTYAQLNYDNRNARQGFLVNTHLVIMSENDRLARFKFSLQIPEPDKVQF